MNKGLVMKITSEYALVLADSNRYYKIVLKEGLSVGQKIYFFEEDLIMVDLNRKQDGTPIGSNFFKKAVSSSVMAACIIFFFMFGGLLGLPNGDNAYAVVSVDINPSVELKLNKNRYVVAVEALNEEGSKVAGLSVVGMKIEDAVLVIINNSVKYKYLGNNDTVLIAGTLNGEAESQADYFEILVKELSDANLPNEYSYLFLPSDLETYKKAKTDGLSLGKYQAVMLTNEKVDIKKFKDMKVKDLIDNKELKSELKEKNPKKHIWIDKNDNSQNGDKLKDKDIDIDKGKDKDKEKDKGKEDKDAKGVLNVINIIKEKNNKDEKGTDQNTDNLNKDNGAIDHNLKNKASPKSTDKDEGKPVASDTNDSNIFSDIMRNVDKDDGDVDTDSVDNKEVTFGDVTIDDKITNGNLNHVPGDNQNQGSSNNEGNGNNQGSSNNESINADKEQNNSHSQVNDTVINNTQYINEEIDSKNYNSNKSEENPHNSDEPKEKDK